MQELSTAPLPAPPRAANASPWKKTVQELAAHPSGLIGAIIILLYLVVAVAAPLLAPYSPTEMDLRARFLPPAWAAGGSLQHLLGTDQLGQDLLSRIIYGSRVSISVGLFSVLISLLVGSVLGSIAGYYQGWFDRIVSRVADLLMAVPYLLFAIFAMAILGPGVLNLIIALSIKAWIEFYRLLRGEIISEKTKEYVEAARMLGRPGPVIIVAEVLPNVIHSLVVLVTLRIGYMIIMEASLSFLGLGVPPEVPAWGSMIAAGRDTLINAWWISTLPGLAILFLVLGINLLGETLRDITDPRLQARE
ncbi:ABC transporter permease [Neomoorella mulderi]|uniref:Glutathione transport system permease protein GsiD n=1 Tax=Moorella mulderi DSM 14980 TaxID=1122241 RepID=A0A151AZT9_9FIRM|nr:ABC transporter permease [Moorella mulderi]KYH33175.1 glutathione transport system permease protein GsiD [Moorella mulderi DSM 14980]